MKQGESKSSENNEKRMTYDAAPISQFVRESTEMAEADSDAGLEEGDELTEAVIGLCEEGPGSPFGGKIRKARETAPAPDLTSAIAQFKKHGTRS